MEIVLDTKNLKIYSEIIDKYTIYYTLERTSYPYYVLTKMEVYKDNMLLLKVNTSINNYDGHTVGAEYQSLIITTPNSQRIIKLNLKNTFIEDILLGTKEEISYFEKNIFKENIYIYFRSKNNSFNMPINESKKKRLLPIFRKKKPAKY